MARTARSMVPRATPASRASSSVVGNLYRPSLARLVLDPSFPVWSVLIAAGLVALAFAAPTLVLPVLLLGWAAFIAFIYVGAKPYPLLLRRRKRIGLPLWAILTLVPLLIYVRQVAINVGELREMVRRARRRQV